MLKHRTNKCLDIPVDVVTMLKHRTHKCLDIPVDVYFNSTLLISYIVGRASDSISVSREFNLHWQIKLSN